MANELAVAYVSLVPTTKGIQAAVAKEMGAPVQSAASDSGKRAGKSFSSSFKTAVKVGAVGLAAVGAIAKGAYDIGNAFDDAFDTIRTGTGKTGKALNGLKDDFRAIARTTPASFGDIGTAVADLNKRLGLTGRPLQRIASQVLELSRLTGTDLKTNIANLTRLFGDWSVPTSRQATTLNRLYRTTQITGIGIDDLSQLMVQFGSPLRQLGFDFETSAVMFGRFEKEGVNLETLLPGLRYALKNLAVPTDDLSKLFQRLGINAKQPNDALLQIFDTISGPGVKEADKTLLASSVFGGRAWADMKAAIEEGRFEFTDLVRQIKTGDDTIAKSSRQTRDFSESWQLFKNRAMLTLEPIAIRVFDAISNGMDKIARDGIPAAQNFARELRPIAQSALQLGREAWPVMVDAGGLALAILKQLAAIVVPLAQGFASLPAPIRNTALAAAAAALVLPKITGAASTAGSAMSNMVLDFRTAPNKMRAVSAAARNLAGPAGIGALLVASQEASPKLATLEGAIGGALLGFSVAGPPGALIGGVAGGFATLAAKSTDAAAALSGFDQRQADADATMKDALSTLNQLNGAYTRQTRQLIAQGILENENTNKLRDNFNLRELVSLSLIGEEAALRQVMARYRETGEITRSAGESAKSYQHRLRLAAGTSLSVLRGPTEELRRQHQELTDLNRGLKDYSVALKGLPKQAITEIQARDGKLTIGVIEDLRQQYKLTPKEVATVIKETGTRVTRQQLGLLFKDYDRLPKDVVTFLKQEGALDVVRDVRRMKDGINAQLGGIDDEPVSVKLNTNAVESMNAWIAQHKNFASGGRVFGSGTGTSDDVPARLSRGEFVVREKIARHLYPFLKALNAGQTEAMQAAGFAAGGRVMPEYSAPGVSGQLATYATWLSSVAGRVAGSIGKSISDAVNELFSFGGTGQPLGPGGTLSPGQAMQGLRFLSAQDGKPYEWAGVGPYGYDCSGLQNAGLNAALGRSPYSRTYGATGNAPWAGSRPGPGQITLGWFTGDPGHMSGNWLGTNVESSGGVGVRIGGGARSPLDSMFNGLMHYDSGGLLRPGYTLAYNGTGRNEIVSAYAKGGKVEGGYGDAFIANVLTDVRDQFGKGSAIVKAIREWLEGLKKGDFSQSALKDEIAEFNEQQKKTLSQNVIGKLKDTFGSGSPVIDAIRTWLDGLKKDEFSRKALNQRLEKVLHRQLDPAIRRFNVSGRQSRSETRGIVNELLGALRSVLGKDSPVVKRVGNLGERLVKIQDRQDNVVAELQKAREGLRALLDRQRQLIADVRSAFTHDAFSTEIGSVGASRLQVRADRNDAQKALRQFRRLAARGLDAGIIKQLARSGNTALLEDLARLTPKQLAAYERDIKARNKATAQLGQFVGNKAFGPQIRAQRKVVNQLERSVNHWNRVVDRMEVKVERAAARGTERGVRQGMRDHEHGQRRKRRAKAT